MLSTFCWLVTLVNSTQMKVTQKEEALIKELLLPRLTGGHVNGAFI